MSDDDDLSALRNALAGLVRADAAPQLPLLPLQRMRIVSQGSDGRVSLQRVVRDGEHPDLAGEASGRVPVWMGVPGCSADHTPGQELVLGFGGADASDPIAFLATPRGQPGYVPIRVRFEASGDVRLVSESAGDVIVGAGPTSPVALGPCLEALIQALVVFAGAAGPGGAALVAACTALQANLDALPAASATRLETA